MFYEKFFELCNSRHIAPSTAAQEAGFSNAAATDWKNGCKPRKKNLQRLADYFNVPIEYFNENSTEGGTSMFYERFVKLCVQRNIAPSKAAVEAGLASGTVTGWKKGAPPRSSAVLKLANYFGVPVEYFDGDPIAGIKKEPAAVAGDKLGIDYNDLTDDNEVKELLQSVANNPQLLDLLRVLNQLDPDRVAALAKLVAPDK